MMNAHRRVVSFLSLALPFLSLVPLFASSAQAEPYVAGQVGVTFPGDVSSVHGVRTNAGANLTDLSLKTSLEGGLKAGYFLPGSHNWFGVEAEFFYTNPHLKQQNVTVTPGGGTFSLGGAHVRGATLAFNLIARHPGAQFQPYAGVGLGINWARISGNSAGVGTASDTSPGLNVLAGLRYLVAPHVGLFTEYKYTSATFDFGGHAPNTVDIKGDYSAHHIVVGVGYHF